MLDNLRLTTSHVQRGSNAFAHLSCDRVTEWLNSIVYCLWIFFLRFQVGLALLVTVAFVLQSTSAGTGGYNYAYGVNDPYTGDIKDQQETRNGDQVTGYYRTMDSDGMLRTVNYNAHPKTGFRAVVNRQPFFPGTVLGQQLTGELSDGSQRLINNVLYDSPTVNGYAKSIWRDSPALITVEQQQL